MNLQEIKNLFGVDLTIKNRKPHFVYLRGIYMDQEIENGRNNLNICKELKCNHASGFHYFQRKDFYKNIKEYNEVKIAFDNKDAELFKDIDFRLNNVKYIHYRKMKRKIPKEIKQDEMPEVRWHYIRIIEALRKDNRHKLWEKPMPEFTINDYKILEDLENGK